jgi:hypothetical protein
MENKSNIIKLADARVVQAVRRLKSTRHKDDQIEVRKNQEDIKHPTILKGKPGYIHNNNNGNNVNNKNSSTILQPLNKSISLINNNINNNNKSIDSNLRNMNKNNTLVPKISLNNLNKKDMSKNNSKSRISIDGSILKPGTSSTNKTQNKTQNKTFDYETLKKYKKRKISDYQKNLFSTKSLEKYKEEFVNLINKDVEIKTLLDQIGINRDDDYLLYITNNFFNKPHFLFTLEILILEAVEEANTLKVFRTNKNVLPLKVVKENYYKDEIIKNLKIRIYEEEYKNKFKNFMKSLDTFINDLKIKEL